MRIICGTNFSQASTQAATAAACIAQRAHQTLQLVHAFKAEPERVRDPAELERVECAERMLNMEAARLRDQGATVRTRLLFGAPESTIVECAHEIDAQLIVLGSERCDQSGQLCFHHRLDAIAAHAAEPVLVVRRDEPFQAWASGTRPLRILIGADTSATTDAAFGFIENLRQIGPCDVSALHLFWPPEQFKRLGLSGVRSYVDIDPVVQEALTRELGEHVRDVKVLVEPQLGSYGQRLARAATEAKADLIVVGSHQRTGVSRLWHGSVSRAVLHAAELSVACVPLSSAKVEGVDRAFNTARAVTDFSR